MAVGRLHTVYMYKWLVNSMATIDPDAPQKELGRLLQRVYYTYEEAKKTGDYSSISLQFIQNAGKDDEVQKMIIIDDLRWENHILFGSIGITNRKLESMIRQRNIKTMQYGELTLSSPQQNFEIFTFFAISEVSGKLIILRNNDMPKYVHNLLAQVCSTALGAEPYLFKAELFSERTLRERLKALKKSRLEVSFPLQDLDMSGKPSLKRINQRSQNRGACTIRFTTKFEMSLTDEYIDDILELSETGDCRILKIYESDSDMNSKDAIDLLSDVVQEKREIRASAEQAKDSEYVYSQFASLLEAQ